VKKELLSRICESDRAGGGQSDRSGHGDAAGADLWGRAGSIRPRSGPVLLILDDLGLRQLAPEETVDLYDIIRLRYERGSILLTSNRALEELPASSDKRPAKRNARRSKETAP